LSISAPPRDLTTIPEEQKIFFKRLIDSVFDIWFALDKRTLSQASDPVDTTDATVTTLQIFPLEDETTCNISATVIGVEAGGGNRASYEIAGTFYRNGGSATQQGSTTVLHSAESAAGWNATFDVNSNDVRIRVTGIAATDIRWQANSKTTSLSN